MSENIVPSPLDVTVCVCTFRRASVSDALESIAKQELPPGISAGIVVVDNDVEPTAKEAVEAFRQRSAAHVIYRHAPAQNISIARNAGLDACASRWLAFMDDDESARSDWLANLLSARFGAHAVFGECQAIYGADAPAWIKRGDYHSNRVPLHRTPIDTGYTANVLIDMDFVRRHGLRFDLTLGQSGGEDTIFFHAMFRKGGVLTYAAAAVVYEDVVASRATIDWIAARKYRAGQVYAMMFKRFDRRAYRRLQFLAPFKTIFCVARSLSTIGHPSRAMWWVMRGVFHFGVLCFGLNAKVHQEYGRPPDAVLQS
jgi:succinoglycan biosynthesis protein ExoM